MNEKEKILELLFYLIDSFLGFQSKVLGKKQYKFLYYNFKTPFGDIKVFYK